MSTCYHCDRTVDEYADEERHLGACCTNLPQPWGWSEADHLFNRSRGGDVVAEGIRDDDEGEYEDAEDQRPSCANCGSYRFTVHLNRTVYQVSNVIRDARHNDVSLYIDTGAIDFETDDNDFPHVHSVECDGCGHNATGEVEVVLD